ncbi:hypothetical protein MNV49_006395 [Pseudohyphozyma bogoriensis]|nr:hypothetical protein MNV49_006395 [Pseudohyphozyma bogoriensis]
MSGPFINVGNPNSKEYFPFADPPVGSILPTADFPKNENVPLLFTPLKIRGIEFKNLCQYSAESGSGIPTSWHLVHLGAIAVRGAALTMAEATSVLPNGRISPEDLGIWSDAHTEAFKPITAFIKAQGSVPAIQLAHAGRKASTFAPWVSAPISKPGVNSGGRQAAKEGAENGWTVIAPSAVSFHDGSFPDPVEMSLDDIESFKKAWGDAVRRSVEAGFEVVEIHGAHGYLMHQFLSPLSNKRTDKYGGSLENRMRLPLEIVSLTRSLLPDSHPLFIRISATDWYADGEQNEAGEWISWGPEQSAVFLQECIKAGADLMDVSTGGNWVGQKIVLGPGYQVPFAEKLRVSMEGADKKIPISSVGLITSGKQAEEILQSGKADIISIARELLRNVDCIYDWAQELGVAIKPPMQYERAYSRMLAWQDYR